MYDWEIIINIMHEYLQLSHKIWVEFLVGDNFFPFVIASV